MRHVNAIGMTWNAEYFISTLLVTEIRRIGSISQVEEDRETCLGIIPFGGWEKGIPDTVDHMTLTEYLDAVVRKIPPILTWHECVKTTFAGGYL